MSHELRPCPFCGEVPDLPSDVGTQYEIECECGAASSSVQIYSLMSTEERLSDEFLDCSYGEKFIERAKAEAIKQWNTRYIPEGQHMMPTSFLEEYRDLLQKKRELTAIEEMVRLDAIEALLQSAQEASQ